ncbi:MAG TPA: hypothetical protein VKA94_00145 [Hyphomicrobiales bacterium]|nr:hypothetical protein [Hyphomicrobiales bacterium]
MTEDEKHFLSRMANEASIETDSGRNMVDREDLNRLVRIASRWTLAQRALNKIDDGFEYRYGDEKSRAFVHQVLAEYTTAISSEKSA